MQLSAYQWLVYVILPHTVVAIILGFSLFLYALWLSKKRRGQFAHNPVILAFVAIGLSSATSFTAIIFMGVPPSYVEALWTIQSSESRRAVVAYSFAIVIGSLALKLASSSFLSVTLGKTYLGWAAWFVILFVIGSFVELYIGLAFEDLFRRHSPKTKEILECLVTVGVSTALVTFVFLIDAAALYGKAFRNSTVNLRPMSFGLGLAALLVAALGGLFVLPLLHAVLWILFLIMGVPLFLALFDMKDKGKPFTPRLYLRMYVQAIRTIQNLLTLRSRR